MSMSLNILPSFAIRIRASAILFLVSTLIWPAWKAILTASVTLFVRLARLFDALAAFLIWLSEGQAVVRRTRAVMSTAASHCLSSTGNQVLHKVSFPKRNRK